MSHPFLALWTLCITCTGALGPTIRATPQLEALRRTAEERLGRYDRALGGGPELLITLGQVPEASTLVLDHEIKALDLDGFILRSRNVSDAGGHNTTTTSSRRLVVCAGRSTRAVGYAFFEFLQHLGFAFLHPLKPVLPDVLPQWPALDMHESPRWTIRGSHYHTQHPLELTNLLNGYDDAGQTNQREQWALALPAWEDYLDWLLAQKQNYVEWMLLADRRDGDQTGSFELSDERRWRLKTLVEAAHAKGLEVGADVPLSLKQQHALNLLPNSRNHEEEVRRRIRWLLDCGFDHLGTELGSTEFTRGLTAKEMIHLLNVAQDELGSRRLLVKNHCSSNQRADGFQDPRPGKRGETLNFNYLNYFANPQIVSMPHTVQAYSLLDPAPTYGNSNFSDLRNWTSFLLQQGRPVVFYPETAYWVNFDISVPLFLAPLYALDRVEDADTLDAMHGSVSLLGQLNFESGWQWGYWLANSAQARAAWRKISLKESFQQLLHFLGPRRSSALSQLLVEMAEAQRRLLIRGLRQGGVQTIPAPGTGEGSATGIAYLQGSEGLSDFASMMARYLGEGAPQPDRLHFMELRREAPAGQRLLRAIMQGGVTEVFGSELHGQRQKWFQEHLRPLLIEINSTFADFAKRFADFQGISPQIDDLVVAAEVFSLRASQVLALYEYAALCLEPSDACAGRLETARAALRRAEALVQERSYQMGLERIPNARHLVLEWSEPVPTAYSYGYLWAAHTLFYWHRDQDIVEQEISDLCFRSINDPVELGLTGGGGPWAHWVQSMAQSLLSNRLWHIKLSECLGPPVEPRLGEAQERAIVM